MELIGVAIIIVGFALRLDTIAIVLCAGIATGIASKMSLVEILSVLGKAFVDTRYMSLFLLTLGVIGILERNGLRETSARFIRKLKHASSGRILSAYVFVRLIFSALSLRVQGHIQFVRPLIYPMARGALGFENKNEEKLKGLCNASENYGNFFGQNVFIASPGVLLVVGTLQEGGLSIEAYSVAIASIPIACFAFLYAVMQNSYFDRKAKG